MKIILTFAFIGLMCSPAYAKSKKKVERSNPTAEISIRKGSVMHRYVLLKKGNTRHPYELQFFERNKKKSKRLSKWQGDRILDDASKLSWQSLYREPASRKKCSTYAELRVNGANMRICNEQLRARGEAFAMFSKMNRLF